MLDALVLRGKALRTQQAYIDAVARLARHYRRSPDTLTSDEVQRHLCPHCKAGRWLAIEQLPGQRAGVAAATRTACRGPP